MYLKFDCFLSPLQSTLQSKPQTSLGDCHSPRTVFSASLLSPESILHTEDTVMLQKPLSDHYTPLSTVLRVLTPSFKELHDLPTGYIKAHHQPSALVSFHFSPHCVLALTPGPLHLLFSLLAVFFSHMSTEPTRSTLFRTLLKCHFPYKTFPDPLAQSSALPHPISIFSIALTFIQHIYSQAFLYLTSPNRV